MAIAHPFPFDPTYGYDETALRAIEAPSAPDDFAAFWQDTYAATLAIPLRLTQEPAPSTPGFATTLLRFDTLNGRRVGAWLVVPEEADPRTVVVVGHGYGGREAPDYRTAWLARSPSLYPCAPGFHLSLADDLPRNCAAEHVVHGIASRESYLIRDCVAALWSSVSAMLALFPEAGRVVYHGGSFGGGLGALMLPWEPRIERAALEVPTFGHHPLRLQCRCNGSGEAVRAYTRQHPDAVETLRYYDAATAAALTSQPVLAAPALFDPAVPPPGQFAVANGYRAPGSWLVVKQMGHYGEPVAIALADQRRYLEACQQFFDDHSAGSA